MAIPPHSKPRHKKAPNKRSIIRWCVGTAMLTATALIISIPLIMRAEDNIQQAANVKAYAATITNTANKAIQESKRQAKLYNARLANQTSNQTDGEPATQNPDEYNHRDNKNHSFFQIFASFFRFIAKLLRSSNFRLSLITTSQ